VGTARAALQLARLQGANRVVTLPDLGVYGLLLQLNDPHELVRFADHTLGALRKYDDRKKAQLISTLRTYLERGMNVGRTAAALFVHQNTVGLRLKKIEEVAGISLQEPESWLRLKLALMAADVLGGARPLTPLTKLSAAGGAHGLPNVATESTVNSNNTRRSLLLGSRSA
jgi:DNA-binding PucR family transcriptional regulator